MGEPLENAEIALTEIMELLDKADQTPFGQLSGVLDRASEIGWRAVRQIRIALDKETL